MPLYKDSAARVLSMYQLHQRLRSAECAYGGMQFGMGTNYLPVLEQALDKTVTVIGMSCRLRFR